MKAPICAALLLLAAGASANPDFPGQWIDPQLAGVGEKRLEILAAFRNRLLEAVKTDDGPQMDSILSQGDMEFGRRIWLLPEERFYIYLILGAGDKIISDFEMRRVVWTFKGDSPYTLVASFCPERPEGKARGMGPEKPGYAPDLLDHLTEAFLKNPEKYLRGLEKVPDLAAFLGMARCKPGIIKASGYEKPWLSHAEKKSMAAFAKSFPASGFTADMNEFSNLFTGWTGTGFLFGGGPSWEAYGGQAHPVLSDGFHGGFFFDVNTPAVKVGLDMQIRTFTAGSDVFLEDTLLSAGVEVKMVITSFNAGYSIPVFENAFLTPFTGFLVTNFRLTTQEVTALNIHNHTGSSVGIPFGANFDYLALPFGDYSDLIKCGVGLRLTAVYHYGRWSEAEAGLGDHGFSVEAKVFTGFFGFARL